MVAKSIVLHVDANEVIEPGSGEAENARHFFGMEEVGCLVPMDPHATEVVAKEIIKRIS